MLADYSFKGKLPEKRGDPGIPTIPCTIKNTYVKSALCELGEGVSVMQFSLYKKLNLNKLVPTEVSLQWLINPLLFLLAYLKMFLLWLLMSKSLEFLLSFLLKLLDSNLNVD
jgi:hypothetical protein